MKKILNPYTTLYAIGVIQPATAGDLQAFMHETFPDAIESLDLYELQSFLNAQVAAGRLVTFSWKKTKLYSLTEQGNLYLDPPLRKLRDKFRVYLLRDAHRSKIAKSRTGKWLELVDVSSTSDASTGMKGSEANKLGPRTFGRGNQVYWPRSFRQFRNETGPTDPVRDTFPPLISFHNLATLAKAREQASPKLDYVGIGLALGLSPALIVRLVNKPEKFYREFSLPKKSGGTRSIRSPRLFLKVVQWFLAEFVLSSLPVSDAVHSFRASRSIVTNAIGHERKRFVANIDIQDFFGTITRTRVKSLLRANGFKDDEAEAISRLVTLNNCLPQGAPTSPTISNAILIDFDVAMAAIANNLGVHYSRYADDISMSGADRAALSYCIRKARQLLKKYKLALNDSKTRIASRGGQQRVAGVVVNEQATPSRMYRRRVRAIFHHARISPGNFVERTSELGGYIGYLKQFPKFAGSEPLAEYLKILHRVRIVRRVRAMQHEGSLQDAG